MLNKNLLGSSGIANWIKLEYDYESDDNAGELPVEYISLYTNSKKSLEGLGISLANSQEFVYANPKIKSEMVGNGYLYHIKDYFKLAMYKKYKYKITKTIFNKLVITPAYISNTSTGYTTLKYTYGSAGNESFSSYELSSAIPTWVYFNSRFYRYFLADIFYTSYEGRDNIELYLTNTSNEPSLNHKFLYLNLKIKEQKADSYIEYPSELYLEGWPGPKNSICYTIELSKLEKSFADKIRSLFKNTDTRFYLDISLSTEKKEIKPNPSTSTSVPHTGDQNLSLAHLMFDRVAKATISVDQVGHDKKYYWRGAGTYGIEGKEDYKFDVRPNDRTFGSFIDSKDNSSLLSKGTGADGVIFGMQLFLDKNNKGLMLILPTNSDTASKSKVTDEDYLCIGLHIKDSSANHKYLNVLYAFPMEYLANTAHYTSHLITFDSSESFSNAFSGSSTDVYIGITSATKKDLLKFVTLDSDAKYSSVSWDSYPEANYLFNNDRLLKYDDLLTTKGIQKIATSPTVRDVPVPNTAPSTSGSSISSNTPSTAPSTGSHEGETAWEVSLFNTTDSDDGMADPELIKSFLSILTMDIKSPKGDLLVHIPQPGVEYSTKYKLTVYSKDRPKVFAKFRNYPNQELDLDGTFNIHGFSGITSTFITIKQKEPEWTSVDITLNHFERISSHFGFSYAKHFIYSQEHIPIILNGTGYIITYVLAKFLGGPSTSLDKIDAGLIIRLASGEPILRDTPFITLNKALPPNSHLEVMEATTGNIEKLYLEDPQKKRKVSEDSTWVTCYTPSGFMYSPKEKTANLGIPKFSESTKKFTLKFRIVKD